MRILGSFVSAFLSPSVFGNSCSTICAIWVGVAAASAGAGSVAAGGVDESGVGAGLVVSGVVVSGAGSGLVVSGVGAGSGAWVTGSVVVGGVIGSEAGGRSEENTSELQSLMRSASAVFFL